MQFVEFYSAAAAQFLHSQRSLVSSSYHSDQHRCSRSRPRRTLQRQQTTRGFWLKCRPLKCRRLECRPLKCLQLECHPTHYSDEYYYQSSESKDDFCPNADWTCTELNIARTCGSFDSEGGSCSGLNAYPNATISDCGSISGNSATQNEIYHCGPIACGIDAMPLLNWESGINFHWLRGFVPVSPDHVPWVPPRATVVAAYQAEVQSTG